MKEITLIFPDQLFENHPAISKTRPIFLVEDFLYFRVQPFHKQRLVLLRAAMKNYAQFLSENGFEVHYIESELLKNREAIFSLLAKQKISKIHLAEFADEWLKEGVKAASEKYSWSIILYPSPMFLCSNEEIDSFFKGKKKFSMAQFYAYQRKRLNILMEDGGPVGGKFSFDTENRKRLPKGIEIPKIEHPVQGSSVKEAISYVESHFSNAIGFTDSFIYPVTYVDAKKWLADFIKHRLYFFGDYEDAISKDESFLFHSLLTPMLNIGLLTPLEVVEATLKAYKSGRIPLNSAEGFIRQIIGWREFMRACYLLKGNKMRSSNYFEHKASLPNGFWDGTTGIEPIDRTIKKILKTGYCHHIERLMVLGNFLLLTETDPDLIYEWFMEYFIDSYDWVMVPNVYAMSQYADEGTITTKPYISGSNYILKMSNYAKGDWVDIWDGLFWRFLSKHRVLFQNNPRTQVLLKMLEKNSSTILPKIELAENWLKLNRKSHPN